MIATEKLDSVNVLIERDKTAKENKKQTFGAEKKKIGEFLSLLKRQIKHLVTSRVGTMADMMRQRYMIKLSLEDVCDSKSKKLINVKKEDSRPLNIKNESSKKEQDMSEVIISKICKNEERRINIEFSKEIKEEILSGNCLSDMAINLAQLVIHKQFPSINELEHTE